MRFMILLSALFFICAFQDPTSPVQSITINDGDKCNNPGGECMCGNTSIKDGCKCTISLGTGTGTDCPINTLNPDGSHTAILVGGGIVVILAFGGLYVWRKNRSNRA